MEVYYVGLMIPVIIPPIFVMMTIQLPKKKVFKCLLLMKDVDIGLLKTIHSSSSNRRGRGHRYVENSHDSSRNLVVYPSSDSVRYGYMSQETSHYFSQNWGTRVDVEGRCGYRSQTSHSSHHNPSDRGRLLTLTVSYRCVEGDIH